MVIVITPNILSKNAYLDPDHKYESNFIKLWRLVKIVSLRPYFSSPNIGSLSSKASAYLNEFFSFYKIVSQSQVRGYDG